MSPIGWPTYVTSFSAKMGSSSKIGAISFLPGMSSAVITVILGSNFFAFSVSIEIIIPDGISERISAPCRAFSGNGISSIYSALPVSCLKEESW